VVDALDLCYTKSHVNTFVIISGDSDFSPLVSKLRENNKQVIGVGVKQSTSDLLIANCDEFIFYDDLVRENQRAQARRQSPGSNPPPAPRRSAEEERSRKETQDARRTQGVELAAETFEALLSERGDTGKIWASVLKEAIKRRKPDFSEGRYGFRTFGNLLEEAQARGLLEFGRDEKSGAYVYRSHGVPSGAVALARSEGAGERASQSTATRHDFHAVATASELRADGAENLRSSGRNRGRRSEEADRADGRPTSQNELSVPEDVEAGAERPTSRYFSQPATVGVTLPETAGEDLAPHDKERAAQEEGDSSEEFLSAEAQATSPAPAASRRGRARSGDIAEARSRPRAASPKAGTGRTRVADTAAAAAGDESAAAMPAAGGQEPVAHSDVTVPAQAPVARPRSRARKPASPPAQ